MCINEKSCASFKWHDEARLLRSFILFSNSVPELDDGARRTPNRESYPTFKDLDDINTTNYFKKERIALLYISVVKWTGDLHVTYPIFSSGETTTLRTTTGCVAHWSGGYGQGDTTNIHVHSILPGWLSHESIKIAIRTTHGWKLLLWHLRTCTHGIEPPPSFDGEERWLTSSTLY